MTDQHNNTLGVMITCTTYGMWLRGDRRGWVDDGKILPANPDLHDQDRKRMAHPPWTINEAQCNAAGALICQSLHERMGVPVYALAVESWHLHAVVHPQTNGIGAIVKCIKDAARHGLQLGRPIWATGYDKRWCFDEKSLQSRIAYVERHNIRGGHPAKRWPGITTPAL